MKRYRKATTDLSQEYEIGLKCIDELRKIYPDIPANPKFRRSTSWSTCPYITFNLGIDVISAAKEYQESIDPSDYTLYWDYIHEFEDPCDAICHQPEFYNDFIQCGVDYTDLMDRLHTRNAVLVVHALTKPL